MRHSSRRALAAETAAARAPPAGGAAARSQSVFVVTSSASGPSSDFAERSSGAATSVPAAAPTVPSRSAPAAILRARNLSVAPRWWRRRTISACPVMIARDSDAATRMKATAAAARAAIEKQFEGVGGLEHGFVPGVVLFQAGIWGELGELRGELRGEFGGVGGEGEFVDFRQEEFVCICAEPGVEEFLDFGFGDGSD